MRVTSSKWKEGRITVVPESVEDLWLLSTVLGAGDFVRGRTLRKIRTNEEGEIKRKPITLTLRVVKAEWSESSPVLRVLGTVEQGTDDVPSGVHHSITVDVNDSVTITKEWLSFQRKRIEEASAAKPPKVVICVFDRAEALFAKIARGGYDILAQLKGRVAKKRMAEEGIKDFYAEIVARLEEYDKRLDPEIIVAASPAFWRKELEKKLPQSLRPKIRFATCSGVDKTALAEVLRRPETREALHSSRIAQESQAVDELLADISKGKPAVYGIKEVSEAVGVGAVDILLVIDSFLREKVDSVEPLLRAVDKMNGKIMIVSVEHDAGRQLDGLGGIAARLRFHIS